ncbi:hypothetical protein CALCODRAFT_487776 [Calocera cornea HHB12733]|uniref:GIT Spa2 homology (SHD) domain-containing protein n=1 Tax=Calocera cornea HHB12733 TaxID=1353952 RepID=A0A165CXH1_9BASI|nr:hypothetical protein CALCODRAFT_487776 [Calocera cornea HHB12733]
MALRNGLNMPPPSPSATIYSQASASLSAYREPYRPFPGQPQQQQQQQQGYGQQQQPMQGYGQTQGLQAGYGQPQGYGPPPQGMQQQGMQGQQMQQPQQQQQQLPSGVSSPSNYDKFRGFFEQLRMFLASEDVKEVPGARADPRSKLVKLNEAQFMELSTDVHDECIRRNSPNPTPFLPLRQELHPKRNQARQKLATLSKTKFRDLASDIFYELGRRFPVFRGNERPETPTSSYDDSPSLSAPYGSAAGASSSSLSVPQSLPTHPSDSSTRGTTPTSYSKLDSPFGAPPPPPQQQRGPGYPEDEGNANANAMMRRRPSEASTQQQQQQQQARGSMESARGEVWRRPSERSALSATSTADRRRPSVEQLTLRPNQSPQQPQLPQQQQQQQQHYQQAYEPFSPPPTSTATLGVVNPTMSTMAEEEIEVPYGRDEPDEHEHDAVGGGRPGSGVSSDEGLPRGRREEEEEEEEEDRSPLLTGPSTATLQGGLNALAGGFDARMREFDDPSHAHGRTSGSGEDSSALLSPRTEERTDEDGVSTASRGVSEFYDKMSYGRASVASSAAVGKRADRESVEVEKLRREYEFKVATMNNRIQSLEAELGEVTRSRDGSVQQLQAVREEVAKVRDLANDQANTVAELRAELDEARAGKDRDADDAASRLQQAEAELEMVRESFDRFKFEQSTRQPEADPLADNLRSEVQALVNELNELSERNEEMMHEKDNDAAIIRDLNAQIKEWRRKYENAKTELRHMKATSTLSAPQTPKLNTNDGDHLPTSDTGAIADVHVTAFQSSIDALLAAGRSSQPTSVLSAMKNVVTSVASITDDVRAFEVRPRKDKMGVDDEAVRALKDRASATLNNLVMASKNHGTSYGLSPVSLLDAAASHVSSTIVEIVRMLKIRRGTRSFLERAGSNKISPLNNSPDRERLVRSSSAASAGRDGGSGADRNSGPSPIRTNSKRRSGMSGESHNGLPTPDRSTPTNNSLQYLPLDATQYRPPIPNSMRDDDAVPTEGSDDAWAELKPYLEAQSESIVHHIQTVLSGIRSGAKATDLNESLTQIITIVSSIVAVCKDSLPTASAKQGQELLRELSEHCNTLSEAQVMGGEVSKQMRQAMATASFGVAKALKELMKL